MQEISAYKLIKEKLQAIPNLRHKGSLFEKLSKRFLIEHDSANEYESIKLWSDWELRGNKGDRGIDMVITTASNEYIAVQCKYHQNSISYNDISTFLSQLQAGVEKVRFKKGIIISTSKLTRAALEEIEQIRSTGMGIDIDEITEEDFIYSQIDKDWIHRQGEFSKIFPDKSARNVVINTTKGKFSSLIGDAIHDYHFIGDTQAYPLYYYDDLGNRHYAISGYALNLFRRHYGDNLIAEEEIFYYIYAILHHKGYLEKYKNSLAKEAPRIALSKDFKELSALGKELGELHLNYESGEMHESVEYKTLMNAEVEGYYDVEKMTKKGDRILYNQNISITKIPKKAFEYVVNGKNAIDWVIERYQKTMDKDSLIENNPNDYAGGKYVFELLCRIIKLSEKSVDLIEKISEKRFE
ncbi:restriction endonuclease [Helicobacter pylori]|nr:restriction endonuclease [Helicobacter pylori]